jgi:hypothetical protein
MAERLNNDVSATIWDRDIRAELATNGHCPGLLGGGWWKRRLEQITGLTFHHTLSGSPHATARHYVTKEGGRPTIPYHLWVTEIGEILWCLDFEHACWHDHTGHTNKNLSVGLAGSLHLYRPPDVQLDAAASVARWALDCPDLRITLAKIKGHCDYVSTQCPGWNAPASGRWKELLYNRIESGG